MKHPMCHIFILMLLAVLLANCDTRRTEFHGNQETTVKVEVKVLSPESFQETILSYSIATPKVEHVITAQVGGMLVNHHADRGDRVSKGMILFEMDREKFGLHLREQKALLEKSKARAIFMEKEMKRQEPLYKSGAISQETWDRLLLDLATAHAELDFAVATLKEAERDLRLSRIRSPIDGILIQRYLKDGEMVREGTALAVTADISEIIFAAGLSDRELQHVARGDKVDVVIDAFPEKVFDGVVTRISGSSDSERGTFPIEVTVQNRDLRILPGMVGRVKLPGKVYSDKFIVPLTSIQYQEGGAIVYVVENGKAVKRPVTLGKVLGGRVIVDGNLRPGDLMVVVGQGSLAPGIQVKIAKRYTQ